MLLYHAVDTPDPADAMSLRVSPQQFRAQMRLLREEGYPVVPLASLCAAPAGGDGRPRVAITFDDGYRCQAAGVLREFGYPATFFLVSRFLDGVRAPAAYWERWSHLGWDEAAALVRDGFDVGAHSATHPDLRRCGGAELEAEVSGVKQVLEARLGTPVTCFSYPHGRHARRVRRAVARAGYRLGCTSRSGLNRAAGPAYAVRRTEVAGTDTLRDFRWKLQGKYDWLGYWHEIVRHR